METPNRSSVNRRRKATKEAVRSLGHGPDVPANEAKTRSQRFRMRGSASYSYPTRSKQMNHAPKWPTEFRRHVASTHANQRVHGTRALHTLTRPHARRRHAGPGRAGPSRATRSKEHTGCTLYRGILRARNDGDCSCSRSTEAWTLSRRRRDFFS